MLGIIWGDIGLYRGNGRKMEATIAYWLLCPGV